jgi:hypothetical protein
VTERFVIGAADANPVNAGANEATVKTATSARKIFFFTVFIVFSYFLILFVCLWCYHKHIYEI